MDAGDFPSDLRGLAARLAELLANDEIAGAALGAIRERAPDERIALAFMLKLAEQSPIELALALRDPSRTNDLAFCLGASELVGSELSKIGDRWVDFLDDARTVGPADFIASIAYRRRPVADRQEAAAVLGEFKRRVFLQIAIGDLLCRFTVVDTTRALSRLADECIGG